MNNKNDFYDDLYKNHKYDGVYKNDYYNKIMKKDKHKPGSVLVAIICIIFGALIFIGIHALIISENNNNNITSNLQSGQEITLKDSIWVCSSKDNVDRLIDYSKNKNQDAISQMEINGEMKTIESGEKVTIDDIGSIVKLRDSNGDIWYTVYESFKNNN